MAGLGHHGPVGGVPGDHMGRLRVLQAPVEHGVDAEHHGVRQFVPVFRVFADPALVFQLSVQLLDVHAGHPGDDFIPQIGLDVAPDELLVAAQGVGPQGGRAVVLHPPVQPLAQSHAAVLGELHVLKGLQVPVELVQQFLLGLWPGHTGRWARRFVCGPPRCGPPSGRPPAFGPCRRRTACVLP